MSLADLSPTLRKALVAGLTAFFLPVLPARWWNRAVCGLTVQEMLADMEARSNGSDVCAPADREAVGAELAR